MNEVASRIEAVVADVERNDKNKGAGNGNNSEPAVNSHAAYVRDGAGDRSTQRLGGNW